MNEPTDVEVAADCDDGGWIEPVAGTDDADDMKLERSTYDEELGASMVRALSKRKSIRMHELVELG